MIYLAYDGSINGDWIARYAINLASHDAEGRLSLVHVQSGEIAPPRLDERLAAIGQECENAGVALDVAVLPARESVFDTLVDHVPAGADTYLVSGARLKSGSKGYLSGTLSEKLLADHHFNVLALRVVQPGLLGAPHNFLLPEAGDTEGFRVGAGVLKLFAGDIRKVDLLHVMMVKRRTFQRMHADKVARLRDKGHAYLKEIEARLIEQTGINPALIDAHVTVSDDWAREIVIAASHLKSHLICMEAHRHHLGRGFLYGNPMEMVLRDAPSDVAIYRGMG